MDWLNQSFTFYNETNNNGTTVTVSNTYPVETFQAALFASLAWKILPPFLIVFGTIGNVLTIFVLRRREIGHLTARPYLYTLACVDIVVLLTGLCRHWLRKTFSYDLRSLTNFGCKLHIFSVYTSFDVSVWLLVAVTGERFLCVLFPFRSRDIKPRHRMILISAIFVFFVALNMHFFFGVALVQSVSAEVSYTCSALNERYKNFLWFTWTWIDFSAFCFVPFLVIALCNVAILIRLYKSRRRRSTIHPITDVQTQAAPETARRLENSNTLGMVYLRAPHVRFQDNAHGGNDQNQSTSHRNSSTSKRQRAKVPQNTTCLLLTLNSVFLITTAPISIYLIFLGYWPNRSDPKQQAYVQLTYMVVTIVSYINNAINFLLYCLTGPRFRLALRAILGLAVPDFLTSTDAPSHSAVGSATRQERVTDA